MRLQFEFYFITKKRSNMPKNRHEMTRFCTMLFNDTIPLGVYNVSNLRNKEEGGATMKYDQKVMNRLKRIEGQIKGIIKMMEEDKDCKEVVTQLSASRSAIDRAIGVDRKSTRLNSSH